MKRRIFLVCLFYCFLDCRSTKLLRLFSGNLPAMFCFCNSKRRFGFLFLRLGGVMVFCFCDSKRRYGFLFLRLEEVMVICFCDSKRRYGFLFFDKWRSRKPEIHGLKFEKAISVRKFEERRKEWFFCSCLN